MFTEIIKPNNFNFQIGDCITVINNDCFNHLLIVGCGSDTLLVTMPDRLSN